MACVALLVPATSSAQSAIPKIYEVSVNGTTEPVTVEQGETIEVAYTGRQADGFSTRAVSAEKKWIGGRLGDIADLDRTRSFSIAGWVKYTYLDPKGSSCFISI